MAEPQPVIDRDRRALDLKAAAGAQFAREPHIEPVGKTAVAQPLAEPQRVGQVRLRLLEPLEVIGDREMLGDVAFPGRHGAAIGLDPVRHDGSAALGLSY